MVPSYNTARCPNCASRAIIPIVRGLPDAELLARAYRGEVIAAGCLAGPHSPTHHCTSCEHEFISTADFDDVRARTQQPRADRLRRARGCLLGGAVGDALGAPIEFMSLELIRARFGPQGLTDYSPAYGRLGAITDDTQMTLFTAEGLIRARQRINDRGVCNPALIVYLAYLRWLHTQGHELWDDPDFGHPVWGWEPDGPAYGWLVQNAVLHDRRAPGNTCVTSLAGRQWGTIEHRVNDSKDCGGVMRAAPVGLIGVMAPFALGCQIAAITHGHPSGFLSAGVLAEVVAQLYAGQRLRTALQVAMALLRECFDSDEVLRALERAISLADTTEPSAEVIESLGAGWVAEEALAISVYCALTAPDLERGVLLAVNHSGDSDSTGSITGNILGAALGIEAVPQRFVDRLEASEIIDTVAHDLVASHEGDEISTERYPTW